VSRRHDLEEQFPLRIEGVKVILDLDENPEPPFPLSDEDRARWNRAPLSKRRLATFGAPEAGRMPARLAAMTVAGECRAQGIGFDVASHLAINTPITTDTTPERKIARQIPDAARRGYFPEGGRTLLTGCCRDPRPRTSPDTLRRLFAPYCDSACAATCPVLRAIRFPDRAIDETDYAAIDNSDLWAYGSGLGPCHHAVWRQLALIAMLEPDKVARCFDAYIFWKLNGEFTERWVRKTLRDLEDVGLAIVVDAEQPKARHIPALDPEQVVELERRLGVHGKREANLREARMKRSGYLDWIHDESSRGGNEDAIADWNPPAKAVRS
jgi:hypothetical protein